MKLLGYTIHLVYEHSVSVARGTAELWLRVMVVQQPTSSNVYLFESEEAAHAYAKSKLYKDYAEFDGIVGYDVRPLYGK